MRANTLLIAFAAVGVTALAPAAHASQPPPEVRHSTVTYGDLNLATKTGEQTLINRIEHAATRDCGGFPRGPDLETQKHFSMCRKAAEAGAIRKVHNIAITQLFDRETGARL